MKKWTYLAVAGMLLGSAPVFTGCIDNDEPAGITDLRGAKAELLRAKAAVEAARVAEVQANAALIQAQAKTEEARARNEAALAAINEAKAKQEEAKVELQNIQNEAERAKLEEQLRQYERDQQKWEAEMAQAQLEAQNAQKEWELLYKSYEVEYQKMLVELATAQATLVGEQRAALAEFVSDFKDAQKAYREKAADVTKALRAYNDAVANVTEDPNFYKRKLEWDVKEAEQEKAGADEALQKAKDELAEAQNIQASEFAEKKAALDEEIATINQNIISLSVQAAEEMRKIMENDYAQYTALVESYNEFYFRELTSTPFEIAISNHFPWSVTYNKVTIQEKEYKVSDVLSYTGTGTDGYTQALGELKYWIDEFKSWERDENDNEWTRETISRYQYENEKANETLKTKLEAWQDAIDAYQVGSYPDYDASAINGYDDLVTDVTNFNAEVKNYNDAANAIFAAEESKTAAQTEKTTAENAASDARILAEAAAQTARTEASNALSTRYTAEVDKETQLEAAYRQAEAAYQLNPNNQVLKDALDAAKEAYDEQHEIVLNFYTTESEKIQDAYDAAMTEAATTYEDAMQAAEDTYNAAVTAANATITENTTKLNAADTKLKNTIIPAFKNHFTAYETNANEAGVRDDVVISLVSDIDDAYNGDKVVGQYTLKNSLTIEQLTKLDRDALRGVIIARSNALFGSESYGTNEYGDIDAYLVELTTKDVKEKVDAKAAEEGLMGWDYLNLYNSYGLVGEIAKREAMIELATSWTTNGEELQGMIQPLQEAYDALVAQQETYTNESDSRLADIDAKYNEIDEKRLATLEPIEAERNKLQPIQEVLTAVNSALADLIANSSDGSYTSSDVETYIRLCEEIVAKQEKVVYDAETGLLKAQKNLSDWNAGSTSAVKIAEEELADAQQALAEAQEDLDFARTALQTAIEKLSIGETPSAGEEVTE